MDCIKFRLLRFRHFNWLATLNIALIISLFLLPQNKLCAVSSPIIEEFLLPENLANEQEVSEKFSSLQKKIEQSKNPLREGQKIVRALISELNNRYGSSLELKHLCHLIKQEINLLYLSEEKKLNLLNLLSRIGEDEKNLQFATVTSASLPLASYFSANNSSGSNSSANVSPSGELISAITEGLLGVAIGTLFGWTGLGGAVGAFFVGQALTKAGAAGEEVWKRNHTYYSEH